MLEREEELAELAARVGAARAGRGGLVLVEGPPGIGKTRLLKAARHHAGEQGMDVLCARASELDRDFPFGVVRQLFEARALAGGDALLRGAARLAAPLLGADAPGRRGAEAAWAHFHALYWLTANLAEDASVALFVDDVHWADERSLRFLQFLLPRLDELPVLVAVSARTAEAGVDRRAIDAIATDAIATVLRPAPLSADAVAELIARELGEEPDAAFGDACRAATGGNPFLVRELLRELASGGVAPTAASASVVRGLAPPTVARSVLLRLARLGDEATALARAVAVLGDGAPLRRACALAGLDDDRGGEVAAALGDARVLAASRPLAFAHPILRSAVYADIDAGERAASHRRAAALLAAEDAGADALATHLLSTEPTGDARVVATLREAARRALTRGGAPRAVACLRRALAEPPAGAERAAIVLELASAELQAGEPAAAAGHFDEGVRVTADPRSRAACVRERALALAAGGRRDEAFAVCARAADEVAPLDRELALLLEADLIALACLGRHRRAWARERLERHRGRLTGASAGERLLLATQAHLDAFYSDAPAAAVADTAERALAGGRLLDDTAGGESPAFFFAVDALLLADRVEPARRALERAVEEARRAGSAPRLAFASAWRCSLLAREGALVAAEADGRASAELALPQGWHRVVPVILSFVVDVLVERGELDDAQRLLDDSGMADRPADHDLAFDALVHARARARAARGDVAGGRADLARVAPRRVRWNTYATLVPPVLVAPELAGDDRDAERERAERMLRDAHGWATPRAIGMALRAAGLVEGGPRGIELLREAAAVLEGSPARVEYARALADLGAALRRANRRAAARDPLRRALDVADECGARALAERAHQELRAAGGRPRRARISGVDGLTASERRIAALAADGLSNPEIAQALFVTKKTVEAHLGSAYRKLDIHSRTDLPGALRPRVAT